jgi:GNAT superfamily N-acetyltransferase
VIRIRPARIDEGRMLATIFVAAWRGGYPGVVPDDVIDAQTVDSVADEFLDLAAPGLLQTAVAVGDNDDPIGFTRYGPDQEHRAGGYLAALYVHPGVGGGGVGTALVDHDRSTSGSASDRTAPGWSIRAGALRRCATCGRRAPSRGRSRRCATSTSAK